jgi:hypothetical protein
MDMTDLQMGLIGLGGAAVVGVLAYNKWQEHKHRKLAEELLSARQADVLLDEAAADDRADEYAGEASRAIGDFHLPPAVAGATARAGQERVEPLLREASALAEGRRTATRMPPARLYTRHTLHTRLRRRFASLSPAIDYIAAIEVSEPAAAYQIREAQRAALARLGKTVNWIGFNDTRTSGSRSSRTVMAPTGTFASGCSSLTAKVRSVTATCRSSMSPSRIWQPN